MKKKNITLSKKLFLDKETIVELNNDLKENVVGGIAGTVKTPGIGLSGTGCGCAMQTCGIVVCSYAGGCDIGVNM